MSDIIAHGFWLRKQGFKESTCLSAVRVLKTVDRRCNLPNPESAKELLAKSTVSEGRKERIVADLVRYYAWKGIPFDKPRYRKIDKLPYMPLDSELDTLIGGLGRKTATFLQLLRETGMRCGEAVNCRWQDIDAERKTILVSNPEKHGRSRVLKISDRLLSMINRMPKDSTYIFRRSDQNPIGYVMNLRRNFERQRKRLALKLQNPRLMQIHMHSLRHYFGTMTYHRTRDLVYTQRQLGHANVVHTLRYVQLTNFESHDYVVKIASDKAVRVKLLEEGFELIGEDGDEWYLRKRK